MDELARRIEKAGMPKGSGSEGAHRAQQAEDDVADVGRGDVVQLHRLAGQCAVVREVKFAKNLAEAKKVLDEDHFGLEKVKSAFSSIWPCKQRSTHEGADPVSGRSAGRGQDFTGSVDCPATGRKFVRMSLGGVRDEAEIRGHRRTYIGSLPGRIVQNLSKVKTKNPLFMLDEAGQMSMDFRGDPRRPCWRCWIRNRPSFNDHYLEVDLDLSGNHVHRYRQFAEHQGPCSIAWKSSHSRIHRG